MSGFTSGQGGGGGFDAGALSEGERERQVLALLQQLAGIEETMQRLGFPGRVATVAPEVAELLAGGAAGGDGGKAWETGVLVGALFGVLGGKGYPLSFDQPIQEPSHDHVVRGPRWAIGYMEEFGGYWRPVVPIDVALPGVPEEEEEEEEELPPPPVGKVYASPPYDETPRGSRRRDDPDELTPCDEVHDLEPSTQPRAAIAPTPHETTRLSERSKAPVVDRVPTSIGPRPDRAILPGQGRSVIQLPRPVEALGPGPVDERVRLGGGPWAPSASLAARGGMRLLDSFDFVAGSHSVFDAIRTVAVKLNEVIARANDARPHGASALDDAGLYLPPGRGERARIPGALDGTIEHVRNGDGQVQQLVHDGGKVYPNAYDHHRVRIVGTGKRIDDWTLAIAQEGVRHARDLPRLQWRARARTWRIEGGQLEAPRGVKAPRIEVQGVDGAYRSSVTEEGDLVVEEVDGGGDVIATLTFQRDTGTVALVADVTALAGTLGTAAFQDASAFAASSHMHVASAIQFSGNDKMLAGFGGGGGVVSGQEIDVTAAGRALLDDTDAAAQRTTLELGTAALAKHNALSRAVETLGASDGLTTAETETLLRTITLPRVASDKYVARIRIRFVLAEANNADGYGSVTLRVSVGTSDTAILSTGIFKAAQNTTARGSIEVALAIPQATGTSWASEVRGEAQAFAADGAPEVDLAVGKSVTIGAADDDTITLGVTGQVTATSSAITLTVTSVESVVEADDE